MIDPNKPVLRGVIHCHSSFSEDSMTPVSRHLKFAREHALDFLILTDHDTTAGALALRDAARSSMPQLEVPIAAEYKTDEGDVIAVFLERDISARAFPAFVAEARAQGAMLLLPHPFVSHKHPERLAPACDLIETFNSRAKREKNELAEELARRHDKPVFAASDAHLGRALGYAILEVSNRGDLRTSLAGGARCPHPRATPAWETLASQYIKAAKRKDSRLALRLTTGVCRAAVRKALRAR